MDIGLLDHGRERLLGRAPRLEEGREVRALAQLGDGEVNPPSARVPGALAIAVAMIEPLGAARARRRARQGLDFQVHQARGRKGQHLTHEVGISTLLDQLDKRHSVVGHRRLLVQVQASQLEP